MSLRPWREIAVPHEDVLKGTFKQSEFAADLSRVHAGTATAEYQNPKLFFQRTFITEGMRLLLDSVVKRLSGQGGDPVIQLQTAFGGGKTHTLLAVYHLVSRDGGKTMVSDLQGVPAILDAAGITELPQAKVVVLDGIMSSPNQPVVREGQTIRTLWGDLAWQLGKADGYALVADADASGTSPGKAVLETLIERYAPCVILIDELVGYVRQFAEGATLTGGTYDSQLSFVQALTESLKAVPNALLLASLPHSDREAGSQQGVKALRALEHYFGRIQALWKPVATEEAFEIVRRRLFTDINDKAAAESVCRAFADYYTANSDSFPRDTQESHYFDRLMQAYPIHPEVFDRLYEDWSSLDNFQRTRGVLKLMAKVIHRLWKDNDKDPLIMPGSFPLADADTRNEVIYYLPQGWDPVVEKDIDGERAETTEIESVDTRLGSVQACRRSARTIFLGSAPSTPNQMVRGIGVERITLGAAHPGQQVGLYKDALRRLVDRLHYLNSGQDRFWFDTRPNLRREMEDRKRRFQDKEDIFPFIRDHVKKAFHGNGVFSGIHIFTGSNDIPDDWQLRLVVLPPDAALSKSGPSFALEHAGQILKTRGDQTRFKQNRLIFLVPDGDSVGRLKDQVRSTLAWQSIVSDIKEMKLNLDQFQAQQAGKSLAGSEDALKRMIRETYKWLAAPMQEVASGSGLPDSNIKWEQFQINAGSPHLTQEIERVLKENEILITEWAPIHLAKMLKDWFWKDDVKEVSALKVWQQTCQQLYLPRLKDEAVFKNTMEAGAISLDFFGFAQGKKDNRYIGFTFGTCPMLFFDEALLLIEPATAAAYKQQIEAQRAAEEAGQPSPPETTSVSTDGGDTVGTGNITIPSPVVNGSATQRPTKKQFYGSIDLDPILAKKQFSDLVDEVLLQFTSRPGVKVEIAVEIRADSSSGFDDGVQRAVKENCNVLKFKNAEFEE